MKFSGRACRSRSCRSLTFISKVTELVVLKRMSGKDFRISGTLDAVETDGGEGDNDGNGQEDCNCHEDDEEQSQCWKRQGFCAVRITGNFFPAVKLVNG